MLNTSRETAMVHAAAEAAGDIHLDHGIYHGLASDGLTPDNFYGSRRFLQRQLLIATALGDDLPEGPGELIGWSEGLKAREAEAFAAYAARRAAGGARERFATADEARHFVQSFGALRMSLAVHAEHFLPEVLGFQLALERFAGPVAIAAREMAELGVEHDFLGARTGNGVAALADAMIWQAPRHGGNAPLWRRVRFGYRLYRLAW